MKRVGNQAQLGTIKRKGVWGEVGEGQAGSTAGRMFAKVSSSFLHQLDQMAM